MSAFDPKRTYHALGVGQLQQPILCAADVDQREIDTTTPNGRLLFGILAAVAEFERALIKDRQLGGIRRIEFDVCRERHGQEEGPPELVAGH